VTGSAVVELNRRVAGRRDRGARGGARDRRWAALDDYQYLHSTRADLLRRLGRADEARTAFKRALELRATSPSAASSSAGSPSSEAGCPLELRPFVVWTKRRPRRNR
jgi:predicted RNA polymerase sigma factor